MIKEVQKLLAFIWREREKVVLNCSVGNVVLMGFLRASFIKGIKSRDVSASVALTEAFFCKILLEHNFM